MARTGRFGRLPTQAPDLSSQIVSMMEQWQNARDRNILDAWTNKGKFEGKKVTDKMIKAHYKKRRDSYDRDDPEWDEWNNEYAQMRFRISNETVMMNYRMGKVGPQAVAAHYRKWANTMPKNSSYYRNMMQSAGQFAKAASAGRAAASKAYDYNALTRRVNSENGPIKRAGQFIEVLNNYARNHGFIEGNESVFTANTFEAADLAGLMAGIERSGDPEWAEFADAQQKAWPGWSGTLSWGELKKMVNQAIRAKKKQIDHYKKAPSDYSSVIDGLNNDIEDLKDVKRIKPWANALEDYAEAHQEWLEVREASHDPSSFIKGDKGYIEDLRNIRQNLLDIGMFAEAGDVLLEIQAVQGKMETTGTNNEALWQNSSDTTGGTATGSSDLELLSAGQETQYAGADLLLSGKAYLIQVSPEVSETAQSLGEGFRQSWSVQPFELDPSTGKPITPANYMPVARRDAASGGVYAEMLVGAPIRNEQGELLAYWAQSDGQSLFGMRSTKDPTQWFYTPENVFTVENGAQLNPDGSGGYTLVADEQFTQNYSAKRDALQSTNPRAVLEELMGARPEDLGAGFTEEQQKENKQAQREFDDREEALENLDVLGLNLESLPDDPTMTGETPSESARATNILIDSLREQYPIGRSPGGIAAGFSEVDSVEAQTALIRSILRRTWDDSRGPMPSELAYDVALEGDYMTPEGDWTDRETAHDAAMRIAMNDGVDIYDGAGKPFTRGVAPTPTATPEPETGYVNPGIGYDDGVSDPSDIVTPPPPEAKPLHFEDEWTTDEPLSLLDNQIALIEASPARSASTPTMAWLLTDTEDAFTEKDIVPIMGVASLGPNSNDYVMEKMGLEMDAWMSLSGVKDIFSKTMMAMDSAGDMQTTMAGMALGEADTFQAKIEEFPSLGKFYDAQNAANPMPEQHPFGTPGYDAAKHDFIHQAPEEVAAPVPNALKGTFFDRVASNNGMEAPPLPGTTTPFTVPTVQAARDVAKPNANINIPNVGNIGITDVNAPKGVKDVKVPDAPPTPETGPNTGFGMGFGGGYR